MELPAPNRLSLEDAIERLQRIQTLHSSRPWRLVIRKSNPGGMTGHQTTEVQGVYAGIDREAGRVVIEPAKPLTELTAAEVEAIQRSVREGSSWHAYQREKKWRERIAALEAELDQLRSACPPQP